VRLVFFAARVEDAEQSFTWHGVESGDHVRFPCRVGGESGLQKWGLLLEDASG
jgi:hypothetical protein